MLADRVQAPSGLGYAMENRRVISQVLPELYQESDLHRMDPYFAALRSALLNSAHEGIEEPRVVVLSPGTHSETAYDQAFLANTLGFPLVQGSDLTVRDGWVWIKPPGGPKATPTERVDVILRRVDADWCDPLELRGELATRRGRPDRGRAPRPGAARQRPRRRSAGEPGAAAVHAGDLRAPARRAPAPRRRCRPGGAAIRPADRSC